MQTKIQMWGNSLGLRLPKALAGEAGITCDSTVDVTLIDGKIIVTPLAGVSFALDQLLAGVTADNLHGEYVTGPAVGHEAW